MVGSRIPSSDPEATKNWCVRVLGWEFKPSFPTPSGDYYLFAYSAQGGEGIRHGHPAETTNSLPFVHVENTQETFDTAISEGAEEVSPPEKVMEGVTTAIVRTPGDITIGFSGP
jgi:uncharacterized protein